MQVIPARYRGASSSADINAQNRAAHTDIVNAYSGLAKQKATTALANEVITTGNGSLVAQLSALREQIKGLTTSYQSLIAMNSSSVGAGSAGTATMVISLHDTDVSYGGTAAYPQLGSAQRANYAPIYGQILPNISTAPISKAFVVDLLTNQVVLPPGVASTGQPTIAPTVLPFMVEENDPGVAVDGNNLSVWRRNVYFPATQYVSDVQTTLTLTVPQQFINNLTANYVTVHPYPEFGCDITSIVLHGPTGSADVQLLPVDQFGNISAIKNAGKTRILFTDQDVVSVDVTLRAAAPIYSLKPGLQAFVLGAAVIDVGWIGFNQSPAKVLVPFHLSNNYFSTITAVNPVVPGVSAQIYYVTPSGDIAKLNVGDSPLGYCSTVYIELTLTPARGLIPVVDTLSLQFIPR